MYVPKNIIKCFVCHLGGWVRGSNVLHIKGFFAICILSAVLLTNILQSKNSRQNVVFIEDFYNRICYIIENKNALATNYNIHIY